MYSDLYATLAVFGVFLLVLGLGIIAFFMVVNWRIFSKAGKPGWASLVPLYNIYVMSDIIFGNLNYFFAVLITWAVSLIGIFTEISLLSNLAGVASLILSIFYFIKLSKVFGKSGGFVVGTVLLPLIFLPILAFGKAEYIGPHNN